MDLVPELDLKSYFQSAKHLTILHKLEEKKCNSVATLLYMFTRAPPLIYDFFYNSCELTKEELHTLNYLTDRMEKEALKMRDVALKNARILTKVNEAISERKSFRRPHQFVNKYPIWYRVKIGEQIEGDYQHRNRSLQEVNERTGIRLFTLCNWYSKVKYYKKMSIKYPGIMNMNVFGGQQQRDAEIGHMLLEKGVRETCRRLKYKIRGGPRGLCMRLFSYIQCAALSFGEEVNTALATLRLGYSSNSVYGVTYAKLLAFERVYRNWLRNGGKPTVFLQYKDVDGVSLNDKEENTLIDDTVIALSDSLSEEEYIDPKHSRKWEISPEYDERPYPKREMKTPRISSIGHRFSKDKQRKKNIGKSKFDVIEERWAIVILYKYLVMTPAELGCALRLPHGVVWHSLELYETYGPRGLVDNVTQERVVELFEEKHGEEIRKFIDGELARGNAISLRSTFEHLREVTGAGKHMGTLGKVLRKLGYIYCASKVVYKEKHKERVIDMRVDYLREFFANRERSKEEGGQKREIYVDESFIRDFKKIRYCWMTAEQYKTREMPGTSIYNEIAIVGALSDTGWVGVDYPNLEEKLRESNQEFTFSHGTILYFKTLNPDKRDPHTCFTRETFGAYFREKLMPLLEESSLIIMDRAAYHTPAADSEFHVKKAKKPELLEYLIGKGVALQPKSSTQELKAIALEICPYARTYLEVDAEKAGHRVLYTPPYHPELNPIEMAWSMVKKHMYQRNKPDTNSLCIDILPKSFPYVTPSVASKLFSHVNATLHKFYQELPYDDAEQNIIKQMPLV